MFSTPSLLTTVVLALSVSASPLTFRDVDVSMPFALRLNLSGSKLPELDRARASHFMRQGVQMDKANLDEPDSTNERLSRRASSISSINVTNTAVTYVADVKIGSPPTTYSLLIDTGSSNTWVGANGTYAKTKSSTETGNTVSVSYGSGQMTGKEYTDTLSLSSSLVIDKQSIGVATNATGFDSVDGILGLGPTDLTAGTVSGESNVPTVTDNLIAQEKISTEVIGISYNPATSTSDKNGVLDFGGVDSSKYTGSITYAKITKSKPARNYWGFDQSVTYGSSGSTVLDSTAGILDTGTTLVLLATDAFNRYKDLTGATTDSASGLLKISNDQYDKLESLYFKVGKTKFELTSNAQIWPRSLNTVIGGSSDAIYLIVGDLGTKSGQGLDFISGYTFLERFYSVYDTDKNRVGLANTANTKATTN